MTAHDRGDVRNHWEHVHEASGEPFDLGFFNRERFVYETEPPSRPVVVLQRRGTATGLAALRRIHRSVYAENRDLTDTGTLSALAAELGVDPARFRDEFDRKAAAPGTSC